ncbi:hypothetical protein ScPMuIL_016549 [Solemya velum]
MPSSSKYLCFLQVFLLYSIQSSVSMEIDFTIEVEPGVQDCFYENFNASSNDIDIEYQVIEGGELDINFMMQGPRGVILASEKRQTEGVHSYTQQPPGDYKFCFDNTFSRMSSKQVFFEIITDSMEEEDEWFQDAKDDLGELAAIVNMKMVDFKLLIDRVKKNVDKSISLQQILRVFEARDRSIAEDNFQRVNWFSGVYLVIMISVGLTQVIMIRSLFDDNSKLNRIMRSRS